ncbi:unnamed protein product, partial [Amoebophrya sp. A120]
GKGTGESERQAKVVRQMAERVRVRPQRPEKATTPQSLPTMEPLRRIARGGVWDKVLAHKPLAETEVQRAVKMTRRKMELLREYNVPPRGLRWN